MTHKSEPVSIGVDIGGTKIIAGTLTQSGDIISTQQMPTPPTSSDILDSVDHLCHQLADETPATIVGIGVGTAGMVDASTGEVVYANENLPNWTGTKLASIPIGQTLQITVENDVRAMAYAEAVLGAGRDFDSLLCVTVGTGIGGALILDGEIYHGANYSAGEIGYLVVGWDNDKSILFDQLVSGPGIERAYQSYCQLDTRLPLTEISQLAQQGDEIAQKIIREKAKQFGQILGGYVPSVNPQAVVIGGGVPQIGALWWDAMQTAFFANVPPPVKNTTLVHSSLGVEAVMLGAGMLAWKRSQS